ncbi:retropepsin-like aspartic protease [Flavobacterium sp.]|uniref:retropepsin-like aspartic protease n=1 Tax=Flavobacterium sp. TaxID=239 RepID=UPI00286D8570|nr:retropepsin-like aspartic protease [Flavobacterium sp.]
MKNLHQLLDNGYTKIKFKLSKTQHLLIEAKINNVVGNFILDTGASTSCVGFESIDYFKLETSHSKTKASGAGGTNMDTLISKKNILKIGKFKFQKFDLVVFNMSHVNEALIQHKAKPVHGIIGADVLLEGKAIIDYYNGCFYLKKI